MLNKKFLLVISFGLVACSQQDDSNFLFFDNKVKNILQRENDHIVLISELTNFDWHKVCFSEDIVNTLTFYTNKEPVSFSLPINLYYISQKHIQGSLKGGCYKYSDYIKVSTIQTSENNIIRLSKN